MKVGVLPEALKRAMKLVTKVDFRETSELLNDWGLLLSKSSLERLNAAYGKEAWSQAKAACHASSEQALAKQAQAEQAIRQTVCTRGRWFALCWKETRRIKAVLKAARSKA